MIRLIAFAALFAMPAVAQQRVCLTHDVMTELLADRYGEARQTVALDGQGNVIETWANHSTGSWTATLTANGLTCIVSAGDNWRQLPQGEAT